ncbi:MAG: N-acetyl-gamma-glutamyl-phosphate reductase [Bacteroidota bacterium]
MKTAYKKIGVIGAAGYTAGELIRILLNHPDVGEIHCQSNSQGGKKVTEVHTDLVGECDLVFEQSIIYEGLDVIFLCKGHGQSVKFLEAETLPDQLKIIDLSHDFRLKKAGNDFTYALPELNKNSIKTSNKLANPGCFATAIQLGLLPAANSNIIKSDIHVSGITGSTGAGQSLTPTSHFSWRNNNISVYKAFVHQHLQEIGESLTQTSDGTSYKVNFIPYRGNFTRGIITTSYFSTDASLEEVETIYEKYYQEAVFTHVTDRNPDLKQVVNSNKALVYLEKHDDQLMIISMIDNLLKGASGQAVQNMNLMFGLEENTGLKLKSTAF